MTFNVLSIGILFNGLVSAAVALAALALTVFLRRRRQKLDPGMQAYAWFWWFTVLVWAPSTLRYLLISMGYVGPGIRAIDSVVQTAIFFTGPSLFYYAIIRVFHNERLATWTASASVLLGALAVWFILQPDGIPLRDVTAFSADATINPRSFIIFSIEASLILFLLAYDIFRRVQRWRKKKSEPDFYHALYSTSVVVYLVLGSIDESKVMTDWPLVVFRMLYAATFLFVYLIITQDEASRENYLITRDLGAPDEVIS